jgi:hypothetical protein
VPEILGLISWRLSVGPTTRLEGLTHNDRLRLDHPDLYQRLVAWVAEHPVATTVGHKQRLLRTLSEFNPDTFIHHAYKGRATVVGAELGRTLGLRAGYWTTACAPRWRDGWRIGLVGCGRKVEPTKRNHNQWAAKVGYPEVHIKALGSNSLMCEFCACPKYKGKRAGVWDRRRGGGSIPYGGRFVEVISSAYSLDGCDSDELQDHLEEWGFEPLSLPAGVIPDVGGVERGSVLGTGERLGWVDLDRGGCVCGASCWRMSLTSRAARSAVSRMGRG